jgi:hypothetical protein
VCVSVLAVAIRSVGGHHGDLIAVFEPIIGAAFIGTGLLAWLRRPENPVRRAYARGRLQLLPLGPDRRDRALPLPPSGEHG